MSFFFSWHVHLCVDQSRLYEDHISGLGSIQTIIYWITLNRGNQSSQNYLVVRIAKTGDHLKSIRGAIRNRSPTDLAPMSILWTEEQSFLFLRSLLDDVKVARPTKEHMSERNWWHWCDLYDEFTMSILLLRATKLRHCRGLLQRNSFSTNVSSIASPISLCF